MASARNGNSFSQNDTNLFPPRRTKRKSLPDAALKTNAKCARMSFGNGIAYRVLERNTLAVNKTVQGGCAMKFLNDQRRMYLLSACLLALTIVLCCTWSLWGDREPVSDSPAGSAT